jgi:hypothetical protein
VRWPLSVAGSAAWHCSVVGRDRGCFPVAEGCGLMVCVCVCGCARWPLSVAGSAAWHCSAAGLDRGCVPVAEGGGPMVYVCALATVAQRQLLFLC